MSDVVSEPPAEGSEPLLESDKDSHETLMTYGPSSRMPIPVIAVWVCALAGLFAYMLSFYYPDLALWGRP